MKNDDLLKTNEQRSYEIAELWASERFGDLEVQKVRAIHDFIPKDVNSLLDVGCGNGFFLHFLKENSGSRFQQLSGVDRSEAALSHVQVEAHLGEVHSLPFADSTFDAVTCNNVLEHLPLGIYQKALSEIVRVSKKYVIVTVPFDEDIPGSLFACPSCSCRFNVNYHMRAYKENDVRYLFDSYRVKCSSTKTAVDIVIRPVFVARAIKKFHELRLSSTELLPSYAVCPVCGYTPDSQMMKNIAPNDSLGSDSGSALKSIIKGLLPKRHVKRQIIGLFIK